MTLNKTTIDASHDPMGSAISDYYKNGRAAHLRVLSSMFEEDEMPVAHLFRSEQEMPQLEKRALELVRGKVLDIGAGAGCHALVLKKKGFEVKAIDVSPLSCEVMKARGIEDVECINLFDPQLQGKFDTILLLMNGTGIAGKLARLPMLLNRLKELMAEGAQILIDSSDLMYIYENEDGSVDIDLGGSYYGEVDYQMVYKNIKGDSFDWLYVDSILLKASCEQCGLSCNVIEEGNHYDYLARITSTQ